MSFDITKIVQFNYSEFSQKGMASRVVNGSLIYAPGRPEVIFNREYYVWKIRSKQRTVYRRKRYNY